MRIPARLGLLVGLSLSLPPLALAAAYPAGGAAATPAPRRLTAVGQVGGATTAIAAAGTWVAFGEGPRLAIADIANPAEPQTLGRSPRLGGLVAAVELVGTRAYAAAGTGGLVLVDARRPEAPVIAAAVALPGPARDLAVVGTTAFVAAGEAGLVLVDVTDFDQPRILARLALPRSAERVTAAGGHAYVMGATWTADMYGQPYAAAAEVFVVDARDPGHPELGAALAGSDYAFAVGAVAVMDGLLLVAPAGGSAPLSVYSLARPARPELAGQLDAQLFTIHDIAPGARPHTALVASGDGHPETGRVTEVSLATPADPVAGTTWLTSELGQAAVAAGPGGLVLATLAEGGFAVLGTPGGDQAPGAALGALEVMGYARAVATSRNLAFVAAAGSGLVVADASDPARLAVVGHSPAGTGGAVVLYNDVAVGVPAGADPPRWAYAASQHGDVVSSALRVIDVSDAHRPRETGAWHLPWRTATSIATVGTVAYMGHEQGLEVVDVAKPDQPTRVRTVAITDGVADLAVAGDLLYVGGGRYDVGLYNIAKPAAPARLAQLELPGYGLALAAGDGTVYVAAAMSRYGERSEDPRCWLHVVDVRTPTTPTLAASVELPGRATAMTTLPGQVLVALNETATLGSVGAVLAFDVTTPTAPVLVTRLAVTGRPTGLAMLGDDLLVAADAGGLAALRWQWPAYLPRLLRHDPGETAAPDPRARAARAGARPVRCAQYDASSCFSTITR